MLLLGGGQADVHVLGQHSNQLLQLDAGQNRIMKILKENHKTLVHENFVYSILNVLKFFLRVKKRKFKITILMEQFFSISKGSTLFWSGRIRIRQPRTFYIECVKRFIQKNLVFPDNTGIILTF